MRVAVGGRGRIHELCAYGREECSIALKRKVSQKVLGADLIKTRKQ